MSKGDEKPFVPKDKPKSWVVLVISVLAGLLIAGPFIFIGISYDFQFLSTLGKIIFFVAWAIGIVMWLIFISGSLRGKYRELKSLPWSEQVW